MAHDNEALPAKLSRTGIRVANLGLHGAHPAALAGLVDHHLRAIEHRGVLIQFNPLWMSSKRLDLSDDKPFAFNHQALIPQLHPWIPSLSTSLSERVGTALRREIPWFAFTRHLQLAHYDQKTIPQYTIDHPYENLIKPLLRAPDTNAHLSVETEDTWQERGIRRIAYSWVPLANSFQWESFERAIALLRSRRNRVAVLVGPFNEHLLTAANRTLYRALRHDVTRRLSELRVPYWAPEVLPSESFADASHPLAAGYAQLADDPKVEELLSQLR